MSTDPWAATQTSTSAPAKVEHVSNPVSDMNDPFASSSEFAGSGAAWDPRVPFEEIEGRAVIFVPKGFNPEANDPFNEGKTREEYRIDLIVLDGEPFSYTYNAKDAEGNVSEKTVEVKEFPATFRQQSVAQGALIKPLKGVDAAGKFLLGTLKRIPQVRDLKDGWTVEKLEQNRAQWLEQIRATGRAKADPQRSTWGLVDKAPYWTPAKRDLALAWWEGEKARRAAEL